jgi:hypothetical protein
MLQSSSLIKWRLISRESTACFTMWQAAVVGEFEFLASCVTIKKIQTDPLLKPRIACRKGKEFARTGILTRAAFQQPEPRSFHNGTNLRMPDRTKAF